MHADKTIFKDGAEGAEGAFEGLHHCTAVLDDTFHVVHRLDALADTGAPPTLSAKTDVFGAVELITVTGSPIALQVEDPRDDVVFIHSPTGTGEVRQQQRRFPLSRDTWCVVCRDQRFEIALHEPYCHHVLRVPRHFLAGALPGDLTLTSGSLCAHTGIGAVLRLCFSNLLAHAPQLDLAGRRQIGEALINLAGAAIAAYVERERPALSPMAQYHMGRIKAYVHTRLTDPDLTIHSIAHDIGLSPRYLHRLFADSGLRLKQWVLAQRLDACYRDLTSPPSLKSPIYIVAQRWGFADYAHFCRAFRAQFGISPSALRKKPAAS